MTSPSRAARVAAMHAVFAALHNPQLRPEDALKQPLEDENIPAKSAAKSKLARDIVAAFAQHRQRIRQTLAVAADRETDEISLAERAILCAGAAEIIARPKTPAAVVINEFVEIAKQCGAENGVKFVNAALDNIARRLRPPP